MTPWPVEVRAEFVPRCPLRLPRSGMDGVARKRDGVLERLVHVDDEPAWCAAAQPAPDRVVIGARARSTRRGASPRSSGCASPRRRRRPAPLLARFSRDPLIGPSVRRDPYLRVGRRPMPFEALAWGGHRAADRHRPGGRDPAPDRRPARPARALWAGDRELRDVPRQPRSRGSHRRSCEACDLARRARRARPRRAGGRRGTGRPPRRRPRARLAAPAGDPGHRRVDGRGPGAARPGPLRPAAGRRSRPTSSSSGGCAAAATAACTPRRPRSASSSRPTRSGRRSPVPTPCVPRAGPRRRRRAALRPADGDGALPGQELVGERARRRAGPTRLVLEHPRAVGPPLVGILPAERLVARPPGRRRGGSL